MRKIIYHYHLFKNAGTSIDEALRKAVSNVPEGWQTREFPANEIINHKQQIEWILEKKNTVCFSSHTAQLPVSSIDGVDIFPIVFMRHPLLRIMSAYNFEKNQNVKSFGATLARNTSLSGYVETRLSLPNDRQCRNFHSDRLSRGFLTEQLSEEEKSFKTLQELPFVGLVEKFSRSIDHLQSLLREFGFSNFKLLEERKNVSNNVQLSIDDSLTKFREQVSEKLWDDVNEANALDLKLYNFVLENRYE